jgi:hypothetical protein
VGLRIRIVKFMRGLLRFLQVVITLVLLLVVYLHIFGFPGFLKKPLIVELQKVGIAARFGSVHLNVFRGIVARDAVLADAKDPERTLVQINELELQLNWRRLLHKQNALQAIYIAKAEIVVPMPSDGGDPVRFSASDAYATFRFDDDGTIRVDRLTGVYCGIRLNVSGCVKPRAASTALKTPSTAPAGSGREQFLFITKAVRELNHIQVTLLPPQLNLFLDFDLAQPQSGKLLVRLQGRQLQYRGLKLDSVAVDVGMRDGVIAIRQCSARLRDGEISLEGQYDIAAGQFDVNLTSSANPALIVSSLMRDAAPILRDLRFQKNPVIIAHYRLGPETGSLPQLDGTVQTGGVFFRGAEFRSIKFDFDNHGPEVKLTHVDVVTPEGRLTGHGEYHIESTDFSYELDSTVDPTKLLPLMIPTMRRMVEPAWFETPPHIVAKVSGDFVDPNAFAYDAQLNTGRCRYRGVDLEGASAKLQLRESRLDVQDLQLKRKEGEMHGILLADFNRHRVSFDLLTTANPSEMAGLLGAHAAKVMTPYRFGPHTDAGIRGVVDFDDPERTAWIAHVTNEGFSYWKFTADRAQANLVFTNNTMEINDFNADLYSGKLQGRATFAFSAADPSYHLYFSTEGVDVHTLLGAMQRRESKVTGVLSGRIQMGGRGADLATLNGEGDMEITDGILWEAPLFGIFSQILGTTKATSAKATFTIADRAVKTDDLEIAAGAFTARSRGQLGFDGRMDFRVDAQFLRAWPGIGWISPLIGKLLEYKVGGTLGDPSYRAVNLPKELLPNK